MGELHAHSNTKDRDALFNLLSDVSYWKEPVKVPTDEKYASCIVQSMTAPRAWPHAPLFQSRRGQPRIMRALQRVNVQAFRPAALYSALETRTFHFYITATWCPDMTGFQTRVFPRSYGRGGVLDKMIFLA